MAINDGNKGPGSRIIRDRAMAVLRETRAKIDPRLLNAMKDHLTAIMPQHAAKSADKDIKEQSPVYPSQIFEDDPVPSQTEPVDRQKIAQIVMQYMKNREDGSKH